MKFEDLIAWQKARQLTNSIYQICREGGLARDYSLRNQLQSAAVSSMTNIAEGFERMHCQEKLQFYNIAKGSAGEVRSLLYVVGDNHLAALDKVFCRQALSADVSALVQGLMNSFRNYRAD
jgi:four helix bundle protein